MSIKVSLLLLFCYLIQGFAFSSYLFLSFYFNFLTVFSIRQRLNNKTYLYCFKFMNDCFMCYTIYVFVVICFCCPFLVSAVL